MALTDNGVDELSDILSAFQGLMDGYLSELDKAIRLKHKDPTTGKSITLSDIINGKADPRHGRCGLEDHRRSRRHGRHDPSRGQRLGQAENRSGSR